MKGFTRSLVLKQRHKDTFIHELLTGAFDLQCVTSALFLSNMLRARKHRFDLCFRVLSNQYVERSAYATVFRFNRENKRFERAKVNSWCFHWFPAAMLESPRRAPTWRLHTKHYNFRWYLLPNNSSSEYRTYPKLWHIVYLLLSYELSISLLSLLNGKRFIFHLRDN